MEKVTIGPQPIDFDPQQREAMARISSGSPG